MTIRRAAALVLAAAVALASSTPARAAATTASIVGTIVAGGSPVAGATLVANGEAGRYTTLTDRSGRFALPAVAPGTYDLTVTKTGFAVERRPGVAVAPGDGLRVQITLRVLATIGKTSRAASPFVVGDPRDTYTVTGAQARAPLAASSSGLASYAAGTVQGAVAAVPGVQQDPFANVLIRGSKVDDVVFGYDAVPLPQAIIAEPGGNVIGPQLPTTGVGYTLVGTGGYGGGADDALGGLVDEIPLAGVFPAQSALRLGIGALDGSRDAEYERRWAAPSLAQRYAFDARIERTALRYGDGRTFYPAEAATYGLALARRAAWSIAGNVHLRSGARDDVEVLALAGEATFDQYGTPFAGQTYGAFDGGASVFPGEPSPAATVTTPTRIRGTYAIEKVQVVRTYDQAAVRVRAYRSSYGSVTSAPFFDDLSFPNGVVSYAGRQSAVLDGVGFDTLSLGSRRHRVTTGLEYRREAFTLDQVVPTLDERITASPVLSSLYAFGGDAWSPSDALTVQAALRAALTHVARSDGNAYMVRSLDPHASVVLKRNAEALRLTYDRTTVAPKPLQAERFDSAQPGAPFVPLAPERGIAYALGYERGGARSRVRFTVFSKSERDRIDVLPADYRSTGGAGASPGAAFGVPRNAGALIANGAELGASFGRLSGAASFVRARSSSASQFALNDLNGAAIAANHLFPAGYVPDLTANASYRITAGRFTIVPTLSYESGYPYGNGRKVWMFGADGKPVAVPNDNHVNPGYNYFFLADPAQPFDPRTNPVVATAGTPEGDDPNTLRSSPLVLFSLRVERTLSPRATLVVEAANVLGASTPTQLQSNPYLIGPPGYTGGSAAYGAWYGAQLAGTPYTLGNGVPTNDGAHAAVPWTYGTGAYVPSSYPQARTVSLRLLISL